jgi:hypothetical protein
MLSRTLALVSATVLLTGCGLTNIPACVFGNGYQFNLKDGSNTSIAFSEDDPKVFVGSVGYLSVGYPCAAIAGVEVQPSEVKVSRNGTPITPTESKRTINQYFPEPMGLHLLGFNDKVDPGKYTYDIEAFVDGKPSGKQKVEIDTTASPLKGTPKLTVTGATWMEAKLNWAPVEGAEEYWVSFSVDDPQVRDKIYWHGLVSQKVVGGKTSFDVADYLQNSLHPDSRSAEAGLVQAANDLKKPIKIDVRAEKIVGRTNWMAHSKTIEIAPGTFNLPAPTYEQMKAEHMAREAKK